MSQAITTTPVDSNAALMSFIERASRDDTFDVAKFEVLLRLQMEVGDKQARRSFNAAMAAAQGEMTPILRTAQNRHLGNKYAKLEDVDREMRPVITRHGFSVRFGSAPAPRDGDMRITCTVAHTDGYFEENHLDSPVTTTGSQGGRMAVTQVQAIGSTVTYLRRYLLMMVFNLVLEDDDDDGEATRRTAAARTPPPERKVAPKVYDTEEEFGPLDEPDGRKWLLNLDVALANAQSQDEVVAIGGHASVNHVTADPAAPADVKRRVTELLAKAFARFADPDTGEIHIQGQEKVEAG